MDLETRNRIITVVLGVVIIFLGYYLYRSIVEHYQVVLHEEYMTERVQHLMTLLRAGRMRYRNENGHLPPTGGGLDSLTQFLKTNDRMVAEGDQLFEEMSPSDYNPDSLRYSPRPPHNEFQYTLNDTLRPQIYLLEDQDSDLAIGDLERTTLLNAPNWH